MSFSNTKLLVMFAIMSISVFSLYGLDKNVQEMMQFESTADGKFFVLKMPRGQNTYNALTTACAGSMILSLVDTFFTPKGYELPAVAGIAIIPSLLDQMLINKDTKLLERAIGVALGLIPYGICSFLQQE